METIDAPIRPAQAAPELAAQTDREQPGVQRHDCYANIHKALRLCLCRTLAQVGSADPDDEQEVAAAAQAVQELLVMSTNHLDKEEKYMHPLLERASPGGAGRAEHDHQHHRASIEHLRALARRAADAKPAARAAALARLYRALALFVADDLRHMHHEETELNALLWSHYTDAELLAVEHGVVASIPPSEMMGILRWFMPAFNAPERLRMLSGMRASAPPPAFEAALSVARDVLSQADLHKLARQLGVPAVPGLVSEARG